MKKPNDVILHSVTKVAVVIILTFSIDLFFAGHHDPGGGFIGGLGFASALTLLFLAFDIEWVRENIPIDFKVVTASGVLIAVLHWFRQFGFWWPFLSQTFDYFNLPIFGKTELATARYF